MDQSDALLESVGLKRGDFSGPIEVYQSPNTHRVVVVATSGLTRQEPLWKKDLPNLYRSISSWEDGKYIYFLEPLT